MADKLLSDEELEDLAERLRVSTAEAKELPKDSSEFNWAKNLPQLPKISDGRKVAVHIPKKRTK